MDSKDNERICTDLISILSEASAWHRIVSSIAVSSSDVINRLLTQPVNLGLDGSSLTIFNTAIPLAHAPAGTAAYLVELVERRCFENETMSVAFAFRWRSFQMDSLIEATVDRCELVRQTLASRGVARGVALHQLSGMTKSENYFVRCRALQLIRNIQSSATPPA